MSIAKYIISLVSSILGPIFACWVVLIAIMVLLGKALVVSKARLRSQGMLYEGLQFSLGNQLEQAQQQLATVREECDRRVQLGTEVYKVATVGLRGCGKSELTFRCWASPLFKGRLEQTQFARYKKTVSRVLGRSIAVSHVMEILDWGGELIHEAQATLILQKINALLMVVDLGGPEVDAFSEERVRDQIRRFNREVLYYFFSPEIIRACQTLVLFINKSDLLVGSLAEVEDRARALYQPLIDILLQFGEKHGVSVEVFVGSARTGARVMRLYAHLIERILPPNALDEELTATLESIKGPETQTALPLPPRRAEPR